MLKYLNITDLFKEIRLYTDENAFEKLKKIYDEFMADTNISTEYKRKVKIFSVKIKQKEEQQSKEEQKKVEETGEFNAIELQLQGKVVRIYKEEGALEIDGKKYQIPKFELRALIIRKDSIAAIVPKEKKIIVTYTDGSTSEITPLS